MQRGQTIGFAWRGALAMNEDKNPQSEEDFDTRLRRARGNDGNDGRGGASVDSQTGKGMAFRIGTEIVVAVAVGGSIGFLIDTWLDTEALVLDRFFVAGKCGRALECLPYHQQPGICRRVREFETSGQ